MYVNRKYRLYYVTAASYTHLTHQQRRLSMARKTKAEAEATRQHLLDAAEQVFFEKGVSGTSLDQIARRAGVTRGAVYWHFSNKVSLLEALIQRVRLPLQQMLDELAGSCQESYPLESLKTTLTEALVRCESPRMRRIYTIIIFRCEFFDQLSDECREHEYTEEATQIFTTQFSRAQKLGQLREGVCPKQAANILYHFLHGLLRDWLLSPELYSIADTGSGMIDLLLDGFRA